jgi:hypothetical protein
MKSRKKHRNCEPLLPMPLLIAVFAVFAGLPAFAEQESDREQVETNVIAAPYVLASSDDGITLGFGFGLNRPPQLYSISSAEYSQSGQMNFFTEGEVRFGLNRYVGRVSFNRSTRSIYPSQPVDPDPLVNADVERVEIKLTVLRPYGRGFEIGPSAWIETAKGMRPEDEDKNPLDLADYPRFIPGTIALGGVRARWLTTSSVRPLDGYVLDLTTQAGAAWSDAWDSAKPDGTVQFKAAMARPMTEWMRMYLRAETRVQWNAPPPIRNFNGGGRLVRGQPKRRETGRRAIYTRAQTHVTLLRDWTWPTEVAHSIFSFIPIYDLELELVPFYDMGVIADPDFGWLPARHGVGAGIHLVIPPELVMRLDVGFSPGGSPRFYFTIGEAI